MHNSNEITMQNQKCLILSQTYYFWRGRVIYYGQFEGNYYAKSEVLDLESNLLFPRGGGIIYYTKLEVLGSNLLFLGGGYPPKHNFTSKEM